MSDTIGAGVLLRRLRETEWTDDGLCPICLGWKDAHGHIVSGAANEFLGNARYKVEGGVRGRRVAKCPMQSQIERLEREIADAEKEKTCAYRDPCGACNAKTYKGSKFCFGHSSLVNAKTCAFSGLVGCNEKVYGGGEFCFGHLYPVDRKRAEDRGDNCCMGRPGCNCRENLPAFVFRHTADADHKHVPGSTCCKEHCFPETDVTRITARDVELCRLTYGNTPKENAERIRDLRKDLFDLFARIFKLEEGTQDE